MSLTGRILLTVSKALVIVVMLVLKRISELSTYGPEPSETAKKGKIVHINNKHHRAKGCGIKDIFYTAVQMDHNNICFSYSSKIMTSTMYTVAK